MRGSVLSFLFWREEVISSNFFKNLDPDYLEVYTTLKTKGYTNLKLPVFNKLLVLKESKDADSRATKFGQVTGVFSYLGVK